MVLKDEGTRNRCCLPECCGNADRTNGAFDTTTGKHTAYVTERLSDCLNV
jgi:hypothetical protein